MGSNFSLKCSVFMEKIAFGLKKGKFNVIKTTICEIHKNNVTSGLCIVY